MKKSNVIEAPLVIADELQFTHEQLLEALYWIFDVFENASIGFVLAYSTAESVLQGKQLEGNKIELGVRKAEWDSGSKALFDTYMQDELIEPIIDGNKYTYITHNGVPIVIYILDEDESIMSPDTRRYENEYFKMPNPYSRFMDRFKK